MISKIQHIATLDNPEIEPYKSLRRPIEHLAQGIFVAEGEKVVTRLLESALTIETILLTQDWFDIYRLLIEKNSNTIEVFIGGEKLLETIVGHSLHQSMMALAKVPTPLTIEELLTRNDKQVKKFFVLVDGVANAENMGVIVRNCACFGVDALIVMSTSCDPYLRRSVRNSMGNIFQLPIVYLNKFADDRRLHGDDHQKGLNKLKQHGIKLYAAHPHPKSVAIGEITFSQQSCIVLGAEGHGISGEILDLCDEFVTIPMKEGINSLNVASASAVMLYEASKQFQ
jgi:TrmH family RNA methyltransferase